MTRLILVTAIIVVLVIIIGFFIERWIARRGKKQENPTINHELAALTSAVTGAFGLLTKSVQQTGQEFMTPNYVKLMPAFKQWIQAEVPDKALQTWLLDLPDEEFRAVTEKVVFFCNDVNVNFAWLLNGNLDIEPETKQVVMKIVIGVCDLHREAVQIQDDLANFNLYQKTLDRLERGDRIELGEKLMVRLYEAELVPVTPPDILLGDQKERSLYTRNVIQSAAQSDYTKFKTIWTSVLYDRHEAS